MLEAASPSPNGDRLVLSMFHTRPGTLFRYLPKTRWVNSRMWAALGFHIEG